MPLDRVFFGHIMTLAFHCQCMNEHGPFALPGRLQHVEELAYVVAVYRAEIGEAKFFPDHGRHDELFEGVLEPLAKLE